MKNILEIFKPELPKCAVIFEDGLVLGIRGDFENGVFRVESKGLFEFNLSNDDDNIPDEEIEVLIPKVLNSIGNPERVILILPDTLFRMQSIEIDSFPKKEEERAKVVLWNAKRNLSHYTDDLRVRYQILEKDGSFVRIWVSAAPERVLKKFESIFSKHNSHVGFITSPTLSISKMIVEKRLFGDGLFLLLSLNKKSISFMFFRDDSPLFYRSKEFLDEEEMAERVGQEIKLTLMYQKEKIINKSVKMVTLRKNLDSFNQISFEFDAETEIKDIASFINIEEISRDISFYLYPFASLIMEAR